MQLCGRTPLCCHMWICSELFCVNALLQMVHCTGRSGLLNQLSFELPFYLEWKTSIYLEGLFTGVHPKMPQQLARFLKEFQTYGTLVHCFMFCPPLGLPSYLRLLLQRNKCDKEGERHDMFIKSMKAWKKRLKLR